MDLFSARIANLPQSCATFHRPEEFGALDPYFGQRSTIHINTGIQNAWGLILGENPVRISLRTRGLHCVEAYIETYFGGTPRFNLRDALRR